MQDAFGRQITYLRVSVTERCNLRCLYCRPAEGGPESEEGLGNEEFVRIIEAAASCGVRKIRLTGGEPLMYQGLNALIRRIREIPGIEQITMTSNALTLAESAADLKKAGLDRINISIDSLDPLRFRRLTRGGDLHRVIAGMNAALDNGLVPVKLNVVLVKGENEDEINDFAGLTMSKPVEVRFLELMPFGVGAQLGRHGVVRVSEVMERLPGLQPVEAPPGEIPGPAQVYRLPGAVGTIGLISPVSSCFCPDCNRIRLTSRGILQPCLFSADGTDLGKAVRAGASLDELARLFRDAVLSKPEDWHRVARNIPDHCGRCALGRPERHMSQVGG